jgi:fumarate reductase (CoM/CoB) subunit A
VVWRALVRRTIELPAFGLGGPSDIVYPLKSFSFLCLKNQSGNSCRKRTSGVFMPLERVFFDVLVIGTGAAGLRAAIAARQMGVTVGLVSKGKAGKSTCTGFSGGVIAGTPEGHDPARHFERTLQAGRELNEIELVKALVEDAPLRLQELLEWGITGQILDGYLFAQGRPPVWGEQIVRCLLKLNRSLGTQFMEETAVTALSFDGGSGAALTYGLKTGCWKGVGAGSVVLAAGGAAALYVRHDNPKRMLGDGYVLALEAGAILQDMEFVQFYPFGLCEAGLPPLLIPPRLADCGKLVNARGEEILGKYGILERPAAERARDKLSRALFMEIFRSSCPVHLDLRGLSPDQWNVDPFSSSVKTLLGERYGALRRPVHVAPMAHHVMGGVKINVDGATSVPGLFAAGEVCGGLHGANRMGGNALAETLVFGAKAGNAGGEWVKMKGKGTWKAAWEKLLHRTSPEGARGPLGVDHKLRLDDLRKIMWQEGGLLRNEHGLRGALLEVEAIEEESAGLGGYPSGAEVGEAIHLYFAARTARLILEGALRRTESRGAHFREDFPGQDDNRWRGHLQARLDPSGKLEWDFNRRLG